MQVELQGSVLIDHETYCVIVSEEDIEMYLQKMFVISSLWKKYVVNKVIRFFYAPFFPLFLFSALSEK